MATFTINAIDNEIAILGASGNDGATNTYQEANANGAAIAGFICDVVGRDAQGLRTLGAPPATP